MKSSVVHKEELSTTPILISSTTNCSQFFNHTINLGIDHDVKVTNTMIKVTYKKPLKDIKSSSPQISRLDIFKDSFENNMIKDFSTSESEVSPSSSREINPPKKRKIDYMNGKFKYKVGDKDDDNSIDILNESKVVKKLKVSKEGKIQSIKFLKSVSGNGNNYFSDDEEEEEKEEDVFKQNIGRIKEKTVTKKNVNISPKIKKIGEKSTKVKSVSVSKNSGAKNIETQKMEEISSRKPILLVDPDLPKGWSRYIRTKNKGCFDEKHIVYVVSPQGKKFRYKWKLRKYLDKTQSDLDIDKFFFGLYKRKSHGTTAEEKDTSEKLIKVSSGNNINSSSQGRQSYFSKKYGKVISKSETAFDADGRKLLLHDHDLPFGWKRIVTSDPTNGKLRVHIISPEGTIFRRKYRLLEYLAKHQYSYTPERFYFGLYPKDENADESKKSGDFDESNISGDDSNLDEDLSEEGDEDLVDESTGGSHKLQEVLSPMYEDPNLPEGWKRIIKVRTCGGTAGRMEVIIISPDGRKHRTRAHLEHYLSRKNLKLNSEDFDFTVFGKSKKRQSAPEPKDSHIKIKRKHFKASKVKPVQDLDLKKVKEPKITPLGQVINSVNGLMVSCGMSSARNERRLPRNLLEKNVKKHLESEPLPEITDINAQWVQTLVKCRGEFRTLDPDAASSIAEKTKLFLQNLSAEAFSFSQHQEEGLKYEDIAEIVDKSDSLTPLKTLIPKRITYKEFVRLNRPKHFHSFT